MARIVSLVKKNKGSSIHDPIDASYWVFEKDGTKFFRIDTYGSKYRKKTGQISQSIQFDKDFAKELVSILCDELL
jgi:hypothetical protein